MGVVDDRTSFCGSILFRIYFKGMRIKLIAVLIAVYAVQQAYSFAQSVNDKASQEEPKAFEAKTIFTIIPDNRPSDYEYAVLSEHVYTDIKQGDIIKIKQEEWQVISIKRDNNGYFGALYKNEQKKQLVLAHRGTKNFEGIIEDLQSVVLNMISSQQQTAYDFTKEAVAQSRSSNFHLFSL